jgi:hypothetical protein
MLTTIRRLGNSSSILIPKALLKQAGLGDPGLPHVPDGLKRAESSRRLAMTN